MACSTELKTRLPAAALPPAVRKAYELPAQLEFCLGLCPKISGRSPEGVRSIAHWGRAATAHQTA